MRAAKLSSPTAVTGGYAPVPSATNAPDRTSSPTARPGRLGFPGRDRLVEPQVRGSQDRTVGNHLIPRRDHHHVVDDDPLDLDRPDSARARLTFPRGARRAAPSRSSARFARTSWLIPIVELATMIPRNRRLARRRRSA